MTSSPTTLLEPSFVDLIAAIEQAAELSMQIRRHWCCSARQIARWLDRPAAVIPARGNGVDTPLRRLHYAGLGVTAKTLANHKSNIRAALRWFNKQPGMPRHGMKLSPEWAAFRDKLDNLRLRERLSSLIRYCSAGSIRPESVSDQILDDYWRDRAETTALATNNAARRLVARAWNVCASASDRWPLQRLTEPPIKPKGDPPWTDFPEGLQKDVDAYFARLSKPHRTFSGRRIRPCKASTIQNGRVELMAVARMAVRLGVPINSLTSLSALLHPDVVEQVIEGYWQKNGNEPKVFTIDLGWKLLRIARETGGLEQVAIERLDEIRAALEDHRRSGLTQKNLQLVRQVLSEGIWSEVVSLSSGLMRQAHSAKDHAPIKAAVTAQLAVAIAILTFAPVRISNLVGIELD